MKFLLPTTMTGARRTNINTSQEQDSQQNDFMEQHDGDNDGVADTPRSNRKLNKIVTLLEIKQKRREKSPWKEIF